MQAELITVGDELLIGQVINTNASWIGSRLADVGIEVRRAVVLGDMAAEIADAVRLAMGRSDLVVVTGGLGPTHDDVTREAMARCFDVPLRLDEAVLAQVRERFERRGRSMAESNRSQAMVPDGFDALPNEVGTAPALWLRRERGAFVVVLPGVPHEMKWLMDTHVLPRVTPSVKGGVVLRETLLTTGIGESNLQDVIGGLSFWFDRGLRLAYLPSLQGVRLRISIVHADAERGASMLAEFESYIQSRAGRFIFGRGEDTLEAAVGRQLEEAGHTVACAESCTGGLISDRLTDVPGSSAYVLGGVIAYDNAVKVEHLGVDPADLDRAGAVSEEVVSAMASGVRHRFGADYGLATSGIMGPGGGAPDKPVGTVWIACAGPDGVVPLLIRLGTDRRRNKERTVIAALNLLRKQFLANSGSK